MTGFILSVKYYSAKKLHGIDRWPHDNLNEDYPDYLSFDDIGEIIHSQVELFVDNGELSSASKVRYSKIDVREVEKEY